MNHLLFLYNPTSGKGGAAGHLSPILDTLTKEGWLVTAYPTQQPGDATRIVRELGSQFDRVVCCGGDGTLSETAAGLMALESPPVLGYIPAGSTNDFATSLGIPKRMPLAAWDIVEGTPFAIDTGTFCEDMNFMYIAAFGAFTEVSYLTSQDRKNLLGHQAYMLEGVKSLAGLKPYHMKVEWDGQVLEEDFAFGMVTNTISVGGFKGLVNQSVALNDGLFEVLLIRMPRTPVDLSNIISYMFLREEPNEYVYKFKTSSIRLTSEQEVDWVLDGEYGGSRTEVTIGNIRENVQILLRNHPEEGSGRKQIE